MVNMATTVGKEKKVENIMTDYQFKTLLKMVLDILKSSKNIEEATERVERFLKDKEDN